HHQHPDTHQHKGKQGTNTHHVAQIFYRHESGKNTDEEHKEDVGFPRRTELGMDITKHFRQQSITAHGIKYPALTHQHHQNHGGISRQNSYNKESLEEIITGYFK